MKILQPVIYTARNIMYYVSSRTLWSVCVLVHVMLVPFLQGEIVILLATLFPVYCEHLMNTQ